MRSMNVTMNPFDTPAFQRQINRRAFLGRAGLGLGGIALASLLRPHARRARACRRRRRRHGVRIAGAASSTPTHFPIRAKRVIHLCMAGGPSHLETFDYKPELKRLQRQAVPRIASPRASSSPSSRARS